MYDEYLPSFLRHPDPATYTGDNYVVLDFETTNHSKGSPYDPRNSIVLAVWKLGKDHPRYKAGGGAGANTFIRRTNEFGLGELVRDIADASFCVAHNAKFELGWLERAGTVLNEILPFCTMVGEYVIGGNRWVGHQLSLDSIAKRRYKDGKIGVVSKMIKNGVPVEDIPERWLRDYCVKDVLLTERLFLHQREDMVHKAGNLLAVAFTRNIVTPALVALEQEGMQLDVTRVTQAYEEAAEAHERLGGELAMMAGGINLNSPKQLAEYLYDVLGIPEATGRGGKPIRTNTGQRSTAAGVVESLKPKNAKQRQFLKLYKEYNDLGQQISKTLKPLYDCCREAGGHLRAYFHQTRTRTHRLSSTGADFGCQFHNFPRRFKSLFCAPKGYRVGESDGAQLEFRAATHLGRDGVALHAIVTGTDIHRVSASVLNLVAPPDVSSDQRQDAKADTFKPLYGGSSGSRDQQRYYAFFRATFDGIAQAQSDWINAVLKDKRLVTEYGMVYYWPDTKVTRSGYITNTTSICNYPVQGFATAEIIPVSLVYCWHVLSRRGRDIYLVNTIHDSLIAYIKEGHEKEWEKLSVWALTEAPYGYLSDVYGVDLTVPLGAGVKIAEHWSEGKEVKYEAEPSRYERAADKDIQGWRDVQGDVLSEPHRAVAERGIA